MGLRQLPGLIAHLALVRSQLKMHSSEMSSSRSLSTRVRAKRTIARKMRTRKKMEMAMMGRRVRNRLVEMMGMASSSLYIAFSGLL